jgi:hypothetical protein
MKDRKERIKIMKKTTTTITKEYDEKGNLIKETETTTTEEDNNYIPNIPTTPYIPYVPTYIYPNDINPWKYPTITCGTTNKI